MAWTKQKLLKDKVKDDFPRKVNRTAKQYNETEDYNWFDDNHIPERDERIVKVLKLN